MSESSSKFAWLNDFFASRRNIFNLVFLLIAIIVVLAIAGEYIAWRLHEQVKLSFASNGATIIYDADSQLKATFRLPASSRWTNTEIMIPPKSSVQIRANGRIHLAVHHVVAAARDDTRPPFDWLGPDGSDFEHERYKDVDKKQLLVMPGAKIGCLLAALHAPGNPGETEPNITTNPRPKRTYKVGSSATIHNTEDRPLQLWLIVNEMYLDSTDSTNVEKQYRVADPTKLSEEEQKSETRRWEYIRDNNYWDLWWDDNIGDFFITIEQ